MSRTPDGMDGPRGDWRCMNLCSIYPSPDPDPDPDPDPEPNPNPNSSPDTNPNQVHEPLLDLP